MQPKTKTLLFILASFIVGILLGWFVESRIPHLPAVQTPQYSTDFLKIMSERVHLTSAQYAQIDSMIEAKRKKMEGFKKQTLALRDSSRAEIRRLLNEDQVKLFDAFIAEKDRWEAKKKEIEAEKK